MLQRVSVYCFCHVDCPMNIFDVFLITACYRYSIKNTLFLNSLTSFVLCRLEVMLERRDILLLGIPLPPQISAVFITCTSSFLWENSQQCFLEVISSCNKCMLLDYFYYVIKQFRILLLL